MISVCIPVYNYDVSGLLTKLNDLAIRLEIPFEILMADDHSDIEYQKKNIEVSRNVNARYIPLRENIGRSAIRNLLCREARFSTLLFLDCDSKVISENFLCQYIPYINKEVVVYGGTLYQEEPPEKKLLLHWKYGREREIKSLNVRNSFPTRYFKTNNFLISKTILLKYSFNEKLQGYGHEDTLLAMSFFQNDIQVIHIENPVEHAGLEEDIVFLNKVEGGLKNLLLIGRMKIDSNVLEKHIHILRVFNKLRNYKLTGTVGFFWNIFKTLLIFLIRKTQNMLLLDIYKIGCLCRAVQQ